MKTAQQRWAKHVEHALGKRDAGALYNALRKYGPGTFKLEVLAENEDWVALCEMEKQAIKEQNTLSPNGYNITLGGEGTQGPLSIEARAAISVAQKKRFQNPQELRKLSERSRKMYESEEFRIQHRNRLKISMSRLDVREKLSRAAKEQFKSKESRLALGAAVRKAMSFPAMRQKLSLIQKSLMTPERRRIISETTKSAMQRPEVREKVLLCAQARAKDPEWREKISKTKTGKIIGPCSEIRKQRIAEARRREWADPVLRAKRLAAFAKARESLKTT